MAGLVARNIGSNISSNLSNSFQTARGTNIDWHDYNFPPCLKLVHFRLSDFQDPKRGVIKKMYISWLLFLLVLSINIISTIVLSATVLKLINILYTFLNLILGTAFATFIFFQGYYGIAQKEERKVAWYKYGQAFLAVVYLVFAFIPFGALNGFAKIAWLTDIGNSAAEFGIAMCVIESLIYLANCALACYCVYLVHTDKVMSI